MCTSGIYHTENIYYSAFMDMRNIFSLRHGRDEPNEAYYRIMSTCASSCWHNPKNYKVYGIIWRTMPFWVRTMTQRPRLLHMMYCAGTRRRYHHAKKKHHLGHWYLSIIRKHAERRYQGMMSDYSQTSRATFARKWDNMQKTACTTHLVHA